MRILNLRPVPMTARRLLNLERRKLIRALRPSAKILASRTKTGAVETLYSSAPRYGAHTLLCVGKRNTAIQLTVHPDNEEIILLKPERQTYKPLYLIVALSARQLLERKAGSGTLGARDFMVLELKYNDPSLCIFTVCKGTPHCEITCPGPGQHPVFFVTEPRKMPGSRIPLPGYKLQLRG